MSLRSFVLVLFCAALLGSTTLGVHTHLELGTAASHQHGHHEHPAHEHAAQPELALASHLDAGHLSDHLEHGDVDIESTGLTSGKSGLPAVLLAVGFIVLLLLVPGLRGACAPPRPKDAFRPLWRQWLLPPPQAPPARA